MLKNQKSTNHGLRYHPLYRVWANIVSRTTNCNVPDYAYYGERGISMCSTWRSSFVSFYEWATENGYTEGLTIDRINNDGDYEPSNCRFVSRKSQMCNTRKIISSNTSGYRGVSYHKRSKKYISRIGVDGKSIHLGMFLDPIDAAIAYDKYVIDNKLEHTINNIKEQ